MMKIFRKLLKWIQKIYRWYREPIPGYRLVRVDPFTILFIIGWVTTSWGVGRGIGAKITADNMADSLRSAPSILKTAVEEAQMTGYDREVALQYVDMMKPAFVNFADKIQEKGWDKLKSAVGVGLVEGVFSLSPFGKAGEAINSAKKMKHLISALEAGGKGIDTFYSLFLINRSIESFDYSSMSFSREQKELLQEIEKVFGMDADKLFKTRMRHTINLLRKNYIGIIQKHPCENMTGEEYQEWSENTQKYLENYSYLYGHGQKWADKNDFFYWVQGEVLGPQDERITQAYEGDLTIENTPLEQCYACEPPSMTGNIKLAINLLSCEVTGEMNAEGRGEVTVNKCDPNTGQSIDEKCTSTGWLKFTGKDIKGNLDRASWKLTFEPVEVKVEQTHQWLQCTGVDMSQKSYTGSDKIPLTGKLGYGWSNLNGNVTWKTSSCQLNLVWKAYKSEEMIWTKTWADRYVEKYRDVIESN